MCQAIQSGSGQTFAAQDFGPVFERQVRGNNDAVPFVRGADHVEQKFGTNLAGWHVTQFVEHKQVQLRKLSFQSQEHSFFTWYVDNSGGTTHPVGQKRPNPWGLYDMHGNVWELCQDWHGDYPSGSVTDPTGATSGDLRVLRGGCWGGSSDDCRSAQRDYRVPDRRDKFRGFRVVRSSIK